MPVQAAEMREFTSESMDSLIHNQKGKPFVLVLWSLDCEFCQASLAALGKSKKTNKNVRVLSIGTDSLLDPQNLQLMKQKLQSYGLSSKAWAFGEEAPERLRFSVDPTWHGEMPRSYWFDAHGKRTAVSGVIDAAEINQFFHQKSD
ncbi:hypothetical protein QN363_16480 [Undibacterium sp. CCC2.1]|nr:hypothetical protein [Undibacterium sp. CCC2.1]MEB0140626.1 hypothetical protein [Undibacterium sp. CCC2.1]MEB0173655.1 hypothetical protein [Undibacterium sp. CCC1.1]